ncbi:F-box protein CPR1-like [Bidens hawaiensis]|uniref:F-box protein CPR1-like n=1 Tax=Bidens hawaiensis TaxID=980011 RepID=UPI00404B3E07
MALEHKHQRSEEEEEDPQSSVLMLFTEIAVEILLKLPVESLLRCKSVCKSLISDPQFVNSHLAMSTRSNNQYAHHRLAFSTMWGRGTVLKSCPLYDSLYDKSVNALKLDFPFKRACDSVWIEGSCNGLLFLAVEADLFIWNPSTRKSIRLPPSGYKKQPGYAVYGFGYQQSNDDYKLVELSSEYDDKCDTTFVKIYSLKTGRHLAFFLIVFHPLGVTSLMELFIGVSRKILNRGL